LFGGVSSRRGREQIRANPRIRGGARRAYFVTRSRRRSIVSKRQDSCVESDSHALSVQNHQIPMNTPIDRRTFVRKAATAGAGIMLFSNLSAATAAVSANRRVRVAIAGTNARGLAHVQC